MTRHTWVLGAVFVAALAASFSASSVPTASEPQPSWSAAQPESLAAAQAHGAIGASFHTIAAGF
jgi:hypothetical protein